MQATIRNFFACFVFLTPHRACIRTTELIALSSLVSCRCTVTVLPDVTHFVFDQEYCKKITKNIPQNVEVNNGRTTPFLVWENL